jgi:hypothetical protein
MGGFRPPVEVWAVVRTLVCVGQEGEGGGQEGKGRLHVAAGGFSPSRGLVWELVE